MEIIKFKTNIQTAQALEKVSNALNTTAGLSSWKLDLRNNDKVLTVFADEILQEEKIIDQIHKAGFYAMNMDDYYAVF